MRVSKAASAEPSFERRLLQVAILVGGLVPVGAGLAGGVLGADAFAPAPHDIALDSHVRYLSGLLLAIGLIFWRAIPTIELQGARVRLLTFIVFMGGLARLFGIASQGSPGAAMLFGLTMELAVTPALCLWQMRVAGLYAHAAELPH